MKKRWAMPSRYLIESSIVRSVIGVGSKAQAALVANQVGANRMSSSTYLRMEFVRGAICPMAEMAAVIRNSDSIKYAMNFLSNTFKVRNAKIYVVVAGILLEKSIPRTPKAWAETVASEAIKWLRRFDAKLKDRTRNYCACERGGWTFEIDYNRLLNELSMACLEFKEPVANCGVNRFLDLGNSKSEASQLIAKIPPKGVLAVDELRELQKAQMVISCGECKKIGDAIIALEQPRSVHLLYSDKAFDTLIAATGTTGTKVPSPVAAERAANPRLPSL